MCCGKFVCAWKSDIVNSLKTHVVKVCECFYQNIVCDFKCTRGDSTLHLKFHTVLHDLNERTIINKDLLPSRTDGLLIFARTLLFDQGGLSPSLSFL